MIILKCRTAERPIAGRRAFNLPQGMSARLFRNRARLDVVRLAEAEE
ncbi:MAG TPA: hypothetical protein VMU69_18040 [Bradyrhizobium sp.]|nr:hypothetical protein [Bradyrhizobium sp.]